MLSLYLTLKKNTLINDVIVMMTSGWSFLLATSMAVSSCLLIMLISIPASTSSLAIFFLFRAAEMWSAVSPFYNRNIYQVQDLSSLPVVYLSPSPHRKTELNNNVHSWTFRQIRCNHKWQCMSPLNWAWCSES